MVVACDKCGACQRGLSFVTGRVSFERVLRCLGREVTRINGLEKGQTLPSETTAVVIECPDFVARVRR